MTVTVLLILAIAAVLTPLIQRDLRIAHARIEYRRRVAAMTPMQRIGHNLGLRLRRFSVMAAAFGPAFSEAIRAAQRAEVETARNQVLWGRGRRQRRWWRR